MNQMSYFSSDLCDCCSDMPICCIGMQYTPCLIGDTYSRVTGRDGCSSCCAYYCLQQCCLCAIVGSNVRKQVRQKYGIVEGSNDILVHCFCGPCAACQEAREVKFRQLQVLSPQQQSDVSYPLVATGAPHMI
eukprot:TRINITY_DN269_c0_g4_i1.p4 TRINITY_DN269_c0_g4~~TRINITY_DN269_c0_g4_i1.p4  ORF type:complete len:132 (-),score=2.39 TRINITY_DN269_c0_g4_i1:126-521(-)